TRIAPNDPHRPHRPHRQGLIDTLTVVDSEGWERSTATMLVEYFRTEIVRPLAIDAGLRGRAASQAEATSGETAASTARRTAYPNAYPNRIMYALIRRCPPACPLPADQHRRTRADLGERVSGS
ncbi:MAG TPA: hypothetical protein VMV41_05695, partial [Cellulomonadaceae bacterium]|nr:hypothetical protein [Cellulomonadaceae bacterium]